MKYGKYRINMFEKNSYIEKEYALCNLGDSAQELAIDKIFSDIGIEESDCIYIARDENFDNHDNNEYTIIPAHMHIFGSNKKRLPLPNNYKPIFISLVLFKDIFIDEPDLLDYFKKNEPIGCRDEYTKTLLKKYGIRAYLMGCFTVCFEPRTVVPDKGKVFIIDIPEQVNDYIPESIKKDAVYLQNSVPYNVYPVTEEEDIRQKEVASKRMEMYKREARLMITGRLHIAIPCIAMGIPVILIRNNFDYRFGWVDKYLPLYTVEDITNIDWNPRSIDLSFARKKIISFLKKSMLGGKDAEKELIELDEYYTNRKRTILNKKIYDTIKDVVNKIGYDNFSYAIWGAGAHCRFVHDIITELYPKAKLKLIVDKYVEGELYGVSIIKGEQLKEINFDHMFITTYNGSKDAICRLEQLLGKKSFEMYSQITTFVKS